jgi:hypothetical protein
MVKEIENCIVNITVKFCVCFQSNIPGSLYVHAHIAAMLQRRLGNKRVE